MRAKQIRPLDNNENVVGSDGVIIITADKSNWSRPGVIIPLIADGRLTIESSRDPLPQTNQTAKIRVSYAPHKGTLIALYSNGWKYHDFDPFIDFTIGTDLDADSNPIAASTPYDVFVYDNGGTTLELVPWNNATNPGVRIVDVVRFDGVWVKNGDFTRRYVGTVVTNASNQFTDSNTARMVWNAHNQVLRAAKILSDGSSNVINATTPSSGADLVQFPGNVGNGIDFVIGLDTLVKCEGMVGGFTPGDNSLLLTLGLDSITTEAPGTMGTATQTLGTGVPTTTTTGCIICYVANHSIIAPGDHLYKMLYRSTITFSGITLATPFPTGSARHGMTLSFLG